MTIITKDRKTIATHSQYIKRSFQSDEHLQDEILNGAVKQGSLFLALQALKEVNELNGFEVVSNYTISKVKSYFRKDAHQELKAVCTNSSKPFTKKRNMKSEKTVSQKTEYGIAKNGFSNIENQNSQKGISKNEKAENEKGNFEKEFQKAYMKMLSK